MLELQLFRIRVLPSIQRELFAREMSRPEILKTVLESRPVSRLGTGQGWHVGNVTNVESGGMYFRLGRTTTSTIETYDEEKGVFLDQQFATAPYTHVMLDLQIEVCGIAKKTKLSATTSGIARQLSHLLNDSQVAAELRAEFEIDGLKDPEDFISQLRGAFSVMKFAVSISRPNAFDKDDFVKPLQKMVEASNADKGKVEVKGKDLDPRVLEVMTRSAASTGDDASARLQADKDERPVTKHLKGSVAVVRQESVENAEERRELLEQIRRLYRRIRGMDGSV